MFPELIGHAVVRKYGKRVSEGVCYSDVGKLRP
jgi:hypothetical protein